MYIRCALHIHIILPEMWERTSCLRRTGRRSRHSSRTSSRSPPRILSFTQNSRLSLAPGVYHLRSMSASSSRSDSSTCRCKSCRTCTACSQTRFSGLSTRCVFLAGACLLPFSPSLLEHHPAIIRHLLNLSCSRRSTTLYHFGQWYGTNPPVSTERAI